MVETGKITQVSEDTATVEFSRSGMCGKCKVCFLSGDAKSVTVKIDNTVAAKVGDEVDVELSGGEVVKASFIAYMIPLLLGAAGLFAGHLLHGEALALFMFALFTGAGFVLVRYIYPRIAKRQARPRIKSIVDKGN